MASDRDVAFPTLSEKDLAALAARGHPREVHTGELLLCLKTGRRWVHLRLCQECGHVGCCDQSPGKHATKHFHASQHPIMRSFERGEDWSWCYVDEVFFEPAVTPRT